MDPFIGEIRIFPFRYAPIGWAWCNGQIMQISQNTQLFSLLGTAFGGNGSTTFGLPNMPGTVPVNWGQGSGLSPRYLGGSGGEAEVTLQQNTVPQHTHALLASASRADLTTPGPQNSLARSDPGYIYKQPAGAAQPQALAANTLGGAVGANQPHNNLMPYLTLYFCIALTGIYPPRS